MIRGRVKLIIGLFAAITIAGILGFMIIEGYNFIDALYMTVITISTVGFETVDEMSDAGKVFTSVLIICSLGIVAFGVTTITSYIIDGVFRNYFKDNKVKKRISKLENHVIVCGYGRNGYQAAVDLIEHNEQVIIIENKDSVVEHLREDTEHLYIEGDATHEDVLHLAHISKAKALITTLPNDADNLFVVLSAREINSNMLIISRANEERSDIKLKRAGATNVIMPDKVGGTRMAKLVAEPDVVEFVEYIMMQSHQQVSLAEVSCENINKCFANKSIRELDVRNASGANIVGLRNEDGTYVINPDPDTILTVKDKLFVLGSTEQMGKLEKVLNQTTPCKDENCCDRE